MDDEAISAAALGPGPDGSSITADPSAARETTLSPTPIAYLPFAGPNAGIHFAHAAEAEFAHLLDFYGVDWRYEPDVFPLEWDGERVVRQFRPDFYLPEYDLYIELTVMKQSLVRRKNRKLRLLRALYPGIQIKLLYRRDFERLLAGFGLANAEGGLWHAEAGVPQAS